MAVITVVRIIHHRTSNSFSKAVVFVKYTFIIVPGVVYFKCKCTINIGLIQISKGQLYEIPVLKYEFFASLQLLILFVCFLPNNIVNHIREIILISTSNESSSSLINGPSNSSTATHQCDSIPYAIKV